MKRRYLAVLLSAALCSSVIFGGCGKTEEPAEAVEEEEEEEEIVVPHHTETEKPPIVDVIGDDELESQINVILKNREAWQVPKDEVAEYDSVGYYVTDLDHNGRIELVTVRWSSEYDYSNDVIYEVNEKGDGLDIIEMEVSGMDADEDIAPDMATNISPYSYFDKKKQAFHYLIEDYCHDYDGTIWVTRYTDVTLLEGKLYVDVYAVSEMDYTFEGDPECTYRLPDEEIGEIEFYEYLNSYPDSKVRKQYYYGAYRDSSGYDEESRSLEEFSLDELKEILTDSYRVFTGSMNDAEYYEKYNTHGKAEMYKNMFDASIGNWEIVSTEIEGSVTEYFWGSPWFYKLQITGNAQAYFEAYDGTSLDYSFLSSITEDENGHLIFVDDIVARTGSTLDWGAAKHVYEIVYVDDKNLELFYDVYDLSGEWLTGSYWIFQRVE